MIIAIFYSIAVAALITMIFYEKCLEKIECDERYERKQRWMNESKYNRWYGDDR